MAVSQHNVRRNMSQWPQASVPRSLMFFQLSHSAFFFFCPTGVWRGREEAQTEGGRHGETTRCRLLPGVRRRPRPGTHFQGPIHSRLCLPFSCIQRCSHLEMSMGLSDVCSSWICLVACWNAPCWPEMSERDTLDSSPCLTKSWTAANFCTTSTSKQQRSWVRVLNVIVKH